MKAHVVVIQFPGVNCEYETVRVLESVGLSASVLRWNAPQGELRSAAAIVLPGGFSYQDRIRAGVVAAKDRITDGVLEAGAAGKPVLGICNGAQILVEAGAVTGFDPGVIDLALAPNRMPDRSGYLCRWVRLSKGPAPCLFTEFMSESGAEGAFPIPMAHAEGRFVTASEDTENRLQRGEGVAVFYADAKGDRATGFPENPNGSMLSIAGISNPDGNVLALMPHPERAAWMHQVPRSVGGSWGRSRTEVGSGSLFAPGPGRGFFESLREALA
ncbi:MAG: phosphoribosylformylglycinamidine synthase I [Candidatus Krumholzibacteria bacterium]|nr:phosphoribosylformylglycinamidine synthase I [Candidatus Krumholzibacteria bacterium]